jgi:hypothetical protein
VAQPVTAANKALAFDSQPDLVVPDPKKKRSPRSTRRFPLGLVILAVIMLALTGGGIWWMASILMLPGDESEDGLNVKTTGNFRFKLPDRMWRKDDGLQKAMYANFAIRRRNPPTSMALVYRDFKTRAASDAELLEEALLRLRKNFDRVEYEDPFQKPVKDRPTLSGQPAAVIEFVGRQDQVDYSGEVYLLTYRGYAYWIFTWGPASERETLNEYWDALRNAFVLGSEREHWQPRPRETEQSEGQKFSFVVNHAKEIWKRHDAPQDYGPDAELVLRGYAPTVDEETGKKTVVEYAGRLATVQFLVLPPQPDLKAAHQAALDYILQEQRKTVPTTVIKPIPDPKTGKPIQEGRADLGKFTGYLSKLQMTGSTEHERFAMLGVVNGPQGVLAIFCEGEWLRRDFWETEFKALLETLRPGGPRKGPPPEKKTPPPKKSED